MYFIDLINFEYLLVPNYNKDDRYIIMGLDNGMAGNDDLNNLVIYINLSIFYLFLNFSNIINTKSKIKINARLNYF